MLSNPTSNLQTRQRQHRRQQSTPTVFEAVKVPTLPPKVQKLSAHRRGMSLDLRRQPTPPQDNKVSYTNTGYQSTPQHILRETQQQRLVRQGPQPIYIDNDENYLNTPLVTPQRQSFDTGCASFDVKHEPVSPYSHPGHFNLANGIDPSTFLQCQDFNLFPIDPSLGQYNYFESGLNYGSPVSNYGQRNELPTRRMSGKRVSGGILDRVNQYENLTMRSSGRPLTPPDNNTPGRHQARAEILVSNANGCRLLASNSRINTRQPEACGEPRPEKIPR